MKQSDSFPQLFLIHHPLVQHKLTTMRQARTTDFVFRSLLREVGVLMAYEMLADLPLTTQEIQTPVASARCPVLSGRPCVLVPILRAGLGMADGILDLVPNAVMGHIGLYRDHESKQPREYLIKLPPLEGSGIVLVDPMLATGGSAVHAVELLLRHGARLEDIRFLCLVAAPEGMEYFAKHYPGIRVFAASLDERLNEEAYILPGLGDAGDRIFGTNANTSVNLSKTTS